MSRKTYPRDLSDSEWLILVPVIPLAKSGSRPRWEPLNAALRESVREQAGRDTEPSAGIMDSQHVKTTETKGERGDDGNTKVTGRKRHILVDVMGLVLVVLVHKVDIQERVGAKLLLQRAVTKGRTRLQLIWADGGYSGMLSRRGTGRCPTGWLKWSPAQKGPQASSSCPGGGSSRHTPFRPITLLGLTAGLVSFSGNRRVIARLGEAISPVSGDCFAEDSWENVTALLPIGAGTL